MPGIEAQAAHELDFQKPLNVHYDATSLQEGTRIMFKLNQSVLIALVACLYLLSGCDHDHDHDHSNGQGSNPSQSHDHDHDDHDHDHDDHDHDHDDHDHDHDHDDHDHDHDDHDHDDHGHAHGPSHTHTVNFDGTELSITTQGEPHPGVELHFEARYVSGDIPENIRVWFGPKSGEGAMKVLAHVHDDHWHAHVECPGMITNSDAMWIELEGTDGNRTSKAIRMH